MVGTILVLVATLAAGFGLGRVKNAAKLKAAHDFIASAEGKITDSAAGLAFEAMKKKFGL
jgi:hypothetical protein